MKTLSATCALLMALSGAAMAQSDKMTPGRELAELVFGSIEDDPNGTADMGEFVSFGQDIYISMDANDDGSVDKNEFIEWDFGFDFIAEDEGQERAYLTAQKVIFAIWDRDADGKITQSEYHKSMVNDFKRADVDDDAFLTRGEFLDGYVVNLAYRAALTGN